LQIFRREIFVCSKLPVLVAIDRSTGIGPASLATLFSSTLIGSRPTRRDYGTDSTGGVTDEEFCEVLADLLIGEIEQ